MLTLSLPVGLRSASLLSAPLTAPAHLYAEMRFVLSCRCVRPDDTSATVRCHYLKDGTAKFAFTIGRAEYFIPVGILLKCFMEVSDKELFGKLLATIPHEQGEASPLHRCALHAV